MNREVCCVVFEDIVNEGQRTVQREKFREVVPGVACPYDLRCGDVEIKLDLTICLYRPKRVEISESFRYDDEIDEREDEECSNR